MRRLVFVIAVGFPLPLPLYAEVISKETGCRTCQQGEYAVVNTRTVGHGHYTYTAQPKCSGGPPADEIGKIFGGVAKAATKDYAGALQDLVTSYSFRQLSEPVHGTVGSILNGGKTDTASCQLMCNLVPEGSAVTDFSIYAGNNPSSLSQCEPGQECPIGWSEFESYPKAASTNSSLVCVNFMNWSDNLDRTVRFVTFFKPPASWRQGKNRGRAF